MFIGLVGFIGSGKGTVGKIFKENGYTIDSFAAPLKDATSIIFNWDRDLLEGDTKESRKWREEPDEYWSKNFNFDFTPRRALQWMGTEACRNVFHKDIWILSLFKRHTNKNEKVLVTDTRFKNEIDYLRKNNGIIIRIKKGKDPIWYEYAKLANEGNNEYKHLMQTTYSHIHSSEWDWIGQKMDYTINNDGTLDDLYKTTIDLIIELDKQT